jgi:ElaB/YqjD/DUF883 family membrane-anchored ribosome-binding protein
MMARQQKNSETPFPGLRERASEAYEGARERAIEAYDSARERAAAARNRAGEGISDAPLLTIGGGLAIGALLGAILPRTRTEERLLGPLGARINDTARTAASAAKEAGREKLAELNITADAGKGAMQSLVDGIAEAAKTSGQAAVSVVRGQG